MGNRMMKKMVLGLMSVACVGGVLFGNTGSADAKVLLKGTARIENPKDKPKGISADTFTIESNNYVGKSFLHAKFKGASSDVLISNRTTYLYKCTDPTKGAPKCTYKERMGFSKGNYLIDYNTSKSSVYFLDEGYYMIKVKKTVMYPVWEKSFFEMSPIFKYKKYGMFE